MSDSVWPQRQQPTRLPHPWDSPGKNTGVGCHFLLQCMKVKSESEVAQSCPSPSDPMHCSLPGSSVHGIFQARVLEWVAIAIPVVGDGQGGLACCSSWCRRESDTTQRLNWTQSSYVLIARKYLEVNISLCGSWFPIRVAWEQLQREV